VTTVTDAVRTPYKGLSPFDDSELDALLFFGRERETEIVVANALASRLTVLYGPSGVGKSSLLRAGVVHALRKLAEVEPIAVAYSSTWVGDPVAGIEEATRGALAEAFGGDPGDAPGDLADRLDAWTAVEENAPAWQSVAWGPWLGSGMVTEQDSSLLERMGLRSLTAPQAFAALFYVSNYYQGIHGDPNTGLSHAWSLAVIGKVENVQYDLDEAIRLARQNKPVRASVHLRLGYALRALEHFTMAYEHWRTAREIDRHGWAGNQAARELEDLSSHAIPV